MSHTATIAIRGYRQSDGMPKPVTFEVARAQALATATPTSGVGPTNINNSNPGYTVLAIILALLLAGVIAVCFRSPKKGRPTSFTHVSIAIRTSSATHYGINAPETTAERNSQEPPQRTRPKTPSFPPIVGPRASSRQRPPRRDPFPYRQPNQQHPTGARRRKSLGEVDRDKVRQHREEECKKSYIRRTVSARPAGPRDPQAPTRVAGADLESFVSVAEIPRPSPARPLDQSPLSLTFPPILNPMPTRFPSHRNGVVSPVDHPLPDLPQIASPAASRTSASPERASIGDPSPAKSSICSSSFSSPEARALLEPSPTKSRAWTWDGEATDSCPSSFLPRLTRQPRFHPIPQQQFPKSFTAPALSSVHVDENEDDWQSSCAVRPLNPKRGRQGTTRTHGGRKTPGIPLGGQLPRSRTLPELPLLTSDDMRAAAVEIQSSTNPYRRPYCETRVDSEFARSMVGSPFDDEAAFWG